MSSIWTVRATGDNRAMDLAEVRKALAVLVDDQAGFQLHLKPFSMQSYRTFSGADLEGACRWLEQQYSPLGVYYTINPVPATLGNNIRATDVLRRRWLLIDIDRNKALYPESSASEIEHEQVRDLASLVMDYLSLRGWPAPVLVDSGNGFHLLYRIDLGADKLSRVLLKNVLLRLAVQFDGEQGSIGRECHDARRIARLPGTWARRGEESPERPYRMARLLYVPDEVGVVSGEQLTELAGASPEQAAQILAPLGGSPFHVQAAESDGKAYARRGLEVETGRICLARPGERNNALNKAAYSLGGLVGAQLLTRDEVEETLTQAALNCGLDEAEIRQTLRSGLDAGIAQPRVIPERPSTNGTTHRNGTGSLERLTIQASKVTPKKIDWLMHNRIPKRFITIFAGQTGIGKSFVLCDLAARLTQGAEIPCSGGEVFDQGNVLFISEDPYEYVLAPRLIELGANLTRVFFLTWEAMAQYTLGDISSLDRAYLEAGRPKLLVIDPPANFLGKTDEHKNSEVRQILMNIVAWLAGRDVAAVLITHVNKASGKGIEAINRVVGSVAWTTTSRIAHSFAIDPNDKDRCLWVPIKNNLGPRVKGLAYQIVSTEALARVEWHGEVDTTADEAMGGTKSQPRCITAAQWLIERFREKLEWNSEELFRAAGRDGVSRNAVFEAKNRLGLPKAKRVSHENGDVSWTWWVPPDWGPLCNSFGSGVNCPETPQ